MKRQDLIDKLSPESHEILKNSLEDIAKDKFFSHALLSSHIIIREIASSIYQKKSGNVPDDINPLFLEELIQSIREEICLFPKNHYGKHIGTIGTICNTEIDVISVIKLRAILNDIHRDFKRILQENETSRPY